MYLNVKLYLQLRSNKNHANARGGNEQKNKMNWSTYMAVKIRTKNK